MHKSTQLDVKYYPLLHYSYTQLEHSAHKIYTYIDWFGTSLPVAMSHAK